MRKAVVSLLLAAGCGGAMTTFGAGGNWRTQATVPGSWTGMSLEQSGTYLSGSGVQHVEAGADRPFTVQGSAQTPGSAVTFTYADQSTEGFAFAQPDADHLTLQSAQRTLQFSRQ